jgi:hypothetical protein
MLAADRARIVDTFEDAEHAGFVAVARHHVLGWLPADTYRVGRLTIWKGHDRCLTAPALRNSASRASPH